MAPPERLSTYLEAMLASPTRSRCTIVKQLNIFDQDVQHLPTGASCGVHLFEVHMLTSLPCVHESNVRSFLRHLAELICC